VGFCRYVETTTLVAEMLDLRESQKLQLIQQLKLERQRIRFESEIGKAPPTRRSSSRRTCRRRRECTVQYQQEVYQCSIVGTTVVQYEGLIRAITRG